MRAIETVEEARRAGAPEASYEQVLLKCVEIRENAADDLAALQRFKDEFVAREIKWEAQRHDPRYLFASVGSLSTT